MLPAPVRLLRRSTCLVLCRAPVRDDEDEACLWARYVTVLDLVRPWTPPPGLRAATEGAWWGGSGLGQLGRRGLNLDSHDEKLAADIRREVDGQLFWSPHQFEVTCPCCSGWRGALAPYRSFELAAITSSQPPHRPATAGADMTGVPCDDARNADSRLQPRRCDWPSPGAPARPAVCPCRSGRKSPSASRASCWPPTSGSRASCRPPTSCSRTFRVRMVASPIASSFCVGLGRSDFTPQAQAYQYACIDLLSQCF